MEDVSTVAIVQFIPFLLIISVTHSRRYSRPAIGSQSRTWIPQLNMIAGISEQVAHMLQYFVKSFRSAMKDNTV